ncbi:MULTISPECIES: hypothetical protein [unclassified Streptomyces]|uniref:hypothetical protein n=1 Tax=unclassified Streptomyces TaxID=2593676 RepID=UPI0036FFBA64
MITAVVRSAAYHRREEVRDPVPEQPSEEPGPQSSSLPDDVWEKCVRDGERDAGYPTTAAGRATA